MKTRKKNNIKTDTRCVTQPLNICLLILHIQTCEHYTIAL